ncbi:AT-hook motif nuclear-localized protein 29-like [Apium graveolens]|uniref:AT-hook motif nuclear-localized protein 29-like n=1 Tax=Apium graveolens TaxID=4045 RepID=UPI003D7AA27F
MEENKQTENSSQIVLRFDSKTNPQNNSSVPSTNRRPPGRPRGSKNKPKPSGAIDRESHNLLKTHMLEVPSGADIMEILNNYARQIGRGMCILYVKGTVSNVIIRQPASSSLYGAVITLPGTFEVISINGTVLPPPAPQGSGSLSIFLSGGHGQVLGGNVVGPLIATGRVILRVASFANAMHERIPLEGHRAVEQESVAYGVNQVREVQPVTSQTSMTESVGANVPVFNVGPALGHSF